MLPGRSVLNHFRHFLIIWHGSMCKWITYLALVMSLSNHRCRCARQGWLCLHTWGCLVLSPSVVSHTTTTPRKKKRWCLSSSFPCNIMDNCLTSWNIECNTSSHMLGCTSLLARCVVAARSSIVCFVAVESLLLTTGACSRLTHEDVGHKYWVVASRIGEGWILVATVFRVWMCVNPSNKGWTSGVVERRVGCGIFLLLGGTDSFTLAIVWRTVWSLGTKCSFPPITEAILAEKPPVETAESVIGTAKFVATVVVSLSTEVPRSSLWLTSLLSWDTVSP